METTSLDWITDRAPTEADADRDGDVSMRLSPRYAAMGWHTHWSYVNNGAPWRHTALWKPPAPPKPPLAVGQVWRRRDGSKDVIKSVDRPDTCYPVSTHDGYTYTSDGNFLDIPITHWLDLVELLTEAPAPKPKPPLAVGQVWRRADNKVVQLTANYITTPTYPFYADGLTYTPAGVFWEGRKSGRLDLVELIREAAAPARHLPGYHGDWIAAAVAMPTAADGDDDGEVHWRLHSRTAFGYTHWTRVGHEAQWMPRPHLDKRPNRPC